jgi:hypothetical protein
MLTPFGKIIDFIRTVKSKISKYFTAYGVLSKANAIVSCEGRSLMIYGRRRKKSLLIYLGGLNLEACS